MSVLLCVWNHQRGELTSFKLHFYGSWHAPHTLFSCWLIRKFPWMQWYIFKTHFPGKLMCSCFLSSTNRPYCRWLALIQKYLITCFSGFSEIFATYCMNVIAVILLKSKVKWKGGAIILYHQNHGLGKYFCKFYISKHYLWWVWNLIFCLFVSTSES